MSENDPINVGERFVRLTPGELVRLLGRLSVGSWLTVLGLTGAVIVGAVSVGWQYRGGSLPEFAYVLHPAKPTPYEAQIDREREAQFASDYSEIVNWQTLQAISASIADNEPDGLETIFEIAASLLAQVRTTRGSATFLSGDEQLSVRIRRTPDGFELDWQEEVSILRRIARDAGYELTDEDVRLHNSNLNWAQFTYLDDAMQHAVVYRDLDGSFGLVVRDPS